MIGAQRRLDAIAAETKRLVEAARRLEECLAARASEIERRTEVRRSKELLRRLEGEVRVEIAGERAQIEIQIASAIGQIGLGIFGAVTNSADNPVMKSLSGALEEIGRPEPVGDIRIVSPPDGDPYVLNLSELARESKSASQILGNLTARGCQVMTWEQFASDVETRLRELGGGNAGEGR